MRIKLVSTLLNAKLSRNLLNLPMKLPLSNSKQFALVDDDLFDHLSLWTWRLTSISRGASYVVRKTHVKGKHVTIYLHRVVMNYPGKMMVDHKKGNTLDNRRENLRVSTNSQNQQNSRGIRGLLQFIKMST